MLSFESGCVRFSVEGLGAPNNVVVMCLLCLEGFSTPAC